MSVKPRCSFVPSVGGLRAAQTSQDDGGCNPRSPTCQPLGQRSERSCLGGGGSGRTVGSPSTKALRNWSLMDIAVLKLLPAKLRMRHVVLKGSKG